MNSLTAVYTLVGILAGFGTIAVAWKQISRRTDEVVSRVEQKVAPLADAADRLSKSLRERRDSEPLLGTRIDQYNAVQAANLALQTVIADSSKSLADAATQLARSTQALSENRAELATALARIMVLEAQVASLEARLGTNEEHK